MAESNVNVWLGLAMTLFQKNDGWVVERGILAHKDHHFAFGSSCMIPKVLPSVSLQ
jgi:hypothetical protein